MKPQHRAFLRNLARIMMLLLFLLLVLAPLLARAGGAGGSSSSSSGSSGRSGGSSGDALALFYLLEIMFRFLGPIPSLIIIAGLVLFFWWANRSHQHQKSNTWSNMNQNRSNTSPGKAQGMGLLEKMEPGFDLLSFVEKVRTAFMAIQTAWSQKKLAGIRRFISDGIYQRFSVQFAMMDRLEQKNILDAIEIHSIDPARFETEGPYRILTVRIKASMHDRFTCGLNTSLNQDFRDTFIEYWTFIKKGSTGTVHDIYHSNNCPSCSAPLPENLGERGNCPHCNALVNSGSFDWVLSEITQEDDYASQRALDRSTNLATAVESIRKHDPDFSSQVLEDKASNAWLQILASRADLDPSRMRRFTSTQAFEKLTSEFPPNKTAYNRLWLNQVSLVGARLDGEKAFLAFSISTSSQRVLMEGGRKVRFLDPVVRLDRQILILGRSTQVLPNKGNLLMHQCPQCGASAADSLDTNCPYCNTAFNAGTHDWVVEDILNPHEYARLFQTEQKTMKVRVNPAVFDQLMDVRDYAFNNFMVMVAADGVFAEEERQMAEDLARKLGYKIDNMEALFNLAASGRMAIRMPDDTAKRSKIIRMLEDAALADGRTSTEEQAVLDYIKKSYLGPEAFRF